MTTRIKPAAIEIVTAKIAGRASNAQIARAIALVEQGKVRWLDGERTMIECQSQRKNHAAYTLYRNRPELHVCEAVEHNKLCVHRIAALLLLAISTAPAPEPTPAPALSYEQKAAARQYAQAYDWYVAEGGELPYEQWLKIWRTYSERLEAGADESELCELEKVLCL